MLKSTNRQELFNFAYIGVIEQGQACYGDYGCQYTAVKDGKTLHCAAGHCMTDDALAQAASAEEKMTGVIDFSQLLDAAVDDDIAIPDELDAELANFIMSIQKYHDSAAVTCRDGGQPDSTFLDMFDTGMRKFATANDLKVPA